jgi:hypothetical protein
MERELHGPFLDLPLHSQRRKLERVPMQQPSERLILCLFFNFRFSAAQILGFQQIAK